MSEATLIGIDLAKRVFQLHGARGDGSVVFRKKLSRPHLIAFVSQQALLHEACPGFTLRVLRRSWVACLSLPPPATVS